MSTALRVEFFFDDEAQNWHSRVPALHINGGGAPSRDHVEAEAMAAITFALQGDPRDYDGDAEAATFEVSVVPPAACSARSCPAVATAFQGPSQDWWSSPSRRATVASSRSRTPPACSSRR